MLKLFPSDVVGPQYLKALRAPLDDIFVPTGGVTPDNVGDYIRRRGCGRTGGAGHRAESVDGRPCSPLRKIRAHGRMRKANDTRCTLRRDHHRRNDDPAERTAGERLERADKLDVPGGAEANLAVALGAHGWRTAWRAVCPPTRLGAGWQTSARVAGVDLDGVVWSDTGRMGTYYVEFASPPRATQVIYDRAG